MRGRLLALSALPALLALTALVLLGPVVWGQDISSGPSAPTDRDISPQDVSMQAPTFLGVYLWEQALWQYTQDQNGDFTVERGDRLGGRLVGGMGFGRLGLEARADVSGLKEQFSAEDPATYTTLEVYGGAFYNVFARDGFQIAPIAVAGSVSSKQSTGGIELDFWGGGVRLAGGGGEFHVVLAKHDYLPRGGWRLSLSGHLPVLDRLYAVWDLVSGEDGYVRVGMAVRVK